MLLISNIWPDKLAFFIIRHKLELYGFYEVTKHYKAYCTISIFAICINHSELSRPRHTEYSVKNKGSKILLFKYLYVYSYLLYPFRVWKLNPLLFTEKKMCWSLNRKALISIVIFNMNLNPTLVAQILPGNVTSQNLTQSVDSDLLGNIFFNIYH